jgi:hypothetical protein
MVRAPIDSDVDHRPVETMTTDDDAIVSGENWKPEIAIPGRLTNAEITELKPDMLVGR